MEPTDTRVRVVTTNQIHDPARGMFTVGLKPYRPNGIKKFHKGREIYIDSFGKRYAVVV